MYEVWAPIPHGLEQRGAAGAEIAWFYEDWTAMPCSIGAQGGGGGRILSGSTRFGRLVMINSRSWATISRLLGSTGFGLQFHVGLEHGGAEIAWFYEIWATSPCWIGAQGGGNCLVLRYFGHKSMVD